MAELTVSVVSADREVWTGAATQVVAKTVIGEIGILAGHEPVLAVLSPGEVRVTEPSGNVVKARTEEGFFSVQANTVTIVAGVVELVA